MAAYGHRHVVFEHLSEEHLLMHSRQTNDWTIVAMVEFHATKKDHWNLHIEIEQNRKDAAAQESDQWLRLTVRFQSSGKTRQALVRLRSSSAS